MDVNNFDIKCADYISMAKALMIQERYGLFQESVNFHDLAEYYVNIVNPPPSVTPVENITYTKKILKFSSHVCQEVDTDITPVKYGALYSGIITSKNGGIGSVAPAGWHIPTLNDWEILINTLGGRPEGGGKLKAIGTTYWLTPNTDATDEAEFDGRGGGFRQADGTYDSFQSSTSFASGDPSYEGIAVSYNSSEILHSYNTIRQGVAIRLVKDTAINTGVMVDIEDNIYQTRKIGNQVWMVTNLIVKHYNDGTVIPVITDPAAWSNDISGGMCFFDNDEATYK